MGRNKTDEVLEIADKCRDRWSREGEPLWDNKNRALGVAANLAGRFGCKCTVHKNDLESEGGWKIIIEGSGA